MQLEVNIMQLRSFPVVFVAPNGKIVMRDPAPVSLPSAEISSLHYHNVCEVGLCRCGSGLWVAGDRVTVIRPGDVMIVPPGVHHYSKVVGKVCRCEFIYFDEGALLKNCGIDKSLTRRLPRNLSPVLRDERIQQYLHAMIETRDDVEAALWYGLFLKNLPEDVALPEFPSDSPLAPVMQRIMFSYGEKLTLGDLAAECGLCQSWFVKRFKQELGCSPIDFLNDFRVRVASQLLRSSMSITEITELSGFGSQSDLYRHFKKKFNCSPSEYRKTMREPDAARARQNR